MSVVATTTPTRARIAAALERVIDPELGVDVVELGLVYDIEIDEELAWIALGMTSASCPYVHRLVEDAAAAALTVPGVTGVDVTLRLQPEWTPVMLGQRARRMLGWR